MKTISYSIVCFSKLIIDIEESKKKGTRKRINNNNLIFSCVDSLIEIRKIFQKIFGNEIDIERRAGLLSSSYISSNNYIVAFETTFSAKISVKRNVQINTEQEENIFFILLYLFKITNTFQLC